MVKTYAPSVPYITRVTVLFMTVIYNAGNQHVYEIIFDHLIT